MAGISNRKSSEEEAKERREHPPIDGTSQPDAAGRVGEDQGRSMPATHKVEGAFGKEPPGNS